MNDSSDSDLGTYSVCAFQLGTYRGASRDCFGLRSILLSLPSFQIDGGIGIPILIEPVLRRMAASRGGLTTTHDQCLARSQE